MGTTPQGIQAHKAWLSAFSDFFTPRTPEWFPNAPRILDPLPLQLTNKVYTCSWPFHLLRESCLYAV